MAEFFIDQQNIFEVTLDEGDTMVIGAAVYNELTGRLCEGRRALPSMSIDRWRNFQQEPIRIDLMGRCEMEMLITGR
jgi:hypothetical protein